MARAGTDVHDVENVNDADVTVALPAASGQQYLPDVLAAALEPCCNAAPAAAAWAHGAAVGTIAVRRGSIGGLALSADGRTLMATNYGDDSVSVIDTDTGVVADTILGPSEPFAIAAGACGVGSRAYIASATASVDSVLAVDMDSAEIVAACPVDLSIDDLVVDPAGKRVYVVGNGANGVGVLVIDASRGPVDAADLCADPGAAAVCVRISPDGGQLYVAARHPGGDAVLVLDAELNLLDTIDVDGTVRDVAVGPDGDTIFVASLDPSARGVVDVVNVRAGVVTDRFEVGSPVTQLVLSRDGERAYLVTVDGVVVMCTTTHQGIGTISLGDTPSCVVESPDGGHLYIADYDGVLTAVSVAVPSASLPTAQLVLDDAISTLLQLEPAI